MTAPGLVYCATCGKPVELHLCGTKVKRPSPELLAMLRSEYDGGLSIHDIAAKYGVTYTLMRRRLIWADTTFRPSFGQRFTSTNNPRSRPAHLV